MFGLTRNTRSKALPKRGFLSRLARDQRGNTLAIVAAITLPLLAMVGSGIDMSRAYMAQARLQQACDAAALAGRRAMTNGTVDSTVIDEAKKFFNFNFKQGTFGTNAFTPIVDEGPDSTVIVRASTRIPTAIMRIFGFQDLPLEIECNAKQDFVNTDIVLVLDVTGSMDDSIGGTKKIVSLRAAVLALYDELKPVQDQLEGVGLRLRYGIVPYSTTVNVGKLLSAADPDNITTSRTYRTRAVNYATPTYIANPPTTAVPVQIYGNALGPISLSQNACRNYGRNQSFTTSPGSIPSVGIPSATSGGGPAPLATYTITYANNQAAGVDWGWAGATDTSGTERTCRRHATTTTTTYALKYKATNYTWVQRDYDTTGYATGNPTTVASFPANATLPGGVVDTMGVYDAKNIVGAFQNGTTTPTTTPNLPTTTNTWNGCIEERKTVSITSSTGYAIPSGAYDLNLDMLPNNDNDTRWAPLWMEAEYKNGQNSPVTNAPCPAEAKRLKAWTRNDMSTYLNSLLPTGNTYHDIGMIWGGRFISRNGVFKADNPTSYTSMPVSLHLIFMSDGQLEPNPDVHTAYGVENVDARITGGGGTAVSNHNQRLKMVCNAIKGMNVSIWVVAFSTGLSSEMTECASSTTQASTTANQAQLIAKFVEIGKNIGALRLTQ